MLVNVGFSTPQVRSLIWEVLSQKALKRGIELVEITQPDTLFFTGEPITTKVLTLVSMRSALKECDYILNEISEVSIDLLLMWHLDRLKLESIRVHRHTFGNLIVILLSKMMRLEGKAPKEELEGLEKLHARFSDLYAEFEKINPKKIK